MYDYDVKDLYLHERRQEIVRLVDQAGRISVADLSRYFGVSEVTIRSDLQALAEQSLLIRTHGGAVSLERGLADISLDTRRQHQAGEKDVIGQAAASLVADGDAIFLDSSSTALAIARHLDQHRFLTVITNSLAIAQQLLDAGGATVVMPGGRLRSETASLIGLDGLGMLDQFNIRKGFFGAHGITVEEGLTDVSAEEADVKRPLVARCRQVIAVLDATKWGQVGVATFATLDQVDAIITNREAAGDLVEQVKTLGPEIILV